MKVGKLTRPRFIFLLVLGIGIVARTWMFGYLPPGLNQDEASSGVDAYSLLHYGVDHNGVSFPVVLVSFGSGQNSLYSYMLIPFVAIGGLTPVTVRLPMLISGILSLPLVFYLGMRLAGSAFGLLGMFFIAISPWHILLSRWGLESNLLPFFFLLGFVSLLKTSTNNYWFAAACLCFAICCYAYGTAYVVIPLMVACSSLILLASNRVRWKALLLGLVVLLVVVTPIIMFVTVNTYRWNSVHWGPVTVPRLPSEARYVEVSALFHSNWLSDLRNNSVNAVELLWSQTDHLIWNVIDPYGYFYTFTFPIAIMGVIGLSPSRNDGNKSDKLLFLSWIVACVPICVLLDININRVNVLFIPLIICMAYPLVWLMKVAHPLFWMFIGVLSIAFGVWFGALVDKPYQLQAKHAFSDGLLPAIEVARRTADAPICVTGQPNMPHIYALFVERTNPREYLASVRYVDAHSPFRQVISFGRYYFGLENCPSNPRTIYVLKDEVLVNSSIKYGVQRFSLFSVYVP